MTTDDYGNIANQGIAAVMFITFISGLLRGWWVLGRELEAMREDRDFWRDMAQRVAGVAEGVVDTRDGGDRSRTRGGR